MRSIGIGRSAGCNDTLEPHLLSIDRRSGWAIVGMIERIARGKLPLRRSHRDDVAVDLSGPGNPR